METMQIIVKISLGLVAFWCVALLVGEALLLRHAISDWMNALAWPSRLSKTNPVFDLTLRILGIQPSDRLATGMLIVAGLLAWPLAISIVPPLAYVFRTRAKRCIEKNRQNNGEALPYPASDLCNWSGGRVETPDQMGS